MNQWTLLVGSLPIVFAISAGALHGLPLDSLQREELFLTAAQSVFAIAVLVSRSISVKEALALFGLFIGQFVLGGILPEDSASSSGSRWASSTSCSRPGSCSSSGVTSARSLATVWSFRSTSCSATTRGTPTRPSELA